MSHAAQIKQADEWKNVCLATLRITVEQERMLGEKAEGSDGEELKQSAQIRCDEKA